MLPLYRTRNKVLKITECAVLGEEVLFKFSRFLPTNQTKKQKCSVHSRFYFVFLFIQQILSEYWKSQGRDENARKKRSESPCLQCVKIGY